MKFLSAISLLCLFTVLTGTSCEKETIDQLPARPTVARKVQFSLYTNSDFSSDNHNITFRLSIQNSANQTLWDSALAPMKIKDIPDAANKIVSEKTILYDASLLKVGFYYAIENVGNSSHLDSFNAGETYKIMNYNFQ